MSGVGGGIRIIVADMIYFPYLVIHYVNGFACRDRAFDMYIFTSLYSHRTCRCKHYIHVANQLGLQSIV